MATLDTHAIARTLIAAGADPKLADAITAAVREAADHGDHVTPDQFKAGLAELEARLTWRFAGAMLAQTGVILAAVIGAAGRHPAHARLTFHGAPQPTAVQGRPEPFCAEPERLRARVWEYRVQGTDTIRAEIHGKELGLSHRSALTTRTDYRYPQSVEDRNRRRAGRGLRSVHGAMVREQIRGPANGKVDCRRPPGRSAAVTGSRVLRSGRGATETGC